MQMNDIFDIRDRELYMDNAATTVIDQEVVAAMQPYVEERYGNPQTPYHLGREAKDAIEKARTQVAELLGCAPVEVYFTSGGTEANNWAIKGFRYGDKDRLLISAIEHASVLEPARWMNRSRLLSNMVEVPVNEEGVLLVDVLESYLKVGRVGLVSVQYANNEVGTVQPIAQISELCKKYGSAFHCDAVQAFGKVDFDVTDVGADMMTLSAHKIHGPMGIGALYIKGGTDVEPLLHGGGHEGGMRSGTHAVPQIVGFGKAVELAWSCMKKEMTRVSAVVDNLAEELKIKFGAIRNGSAQDRLPNILNVTLPNVDAALMCGVLARRGVCVSMGSACRTGEKESRVLKAMNRQFKDCMSTIRISMSRYTDEKQAKLLVAYMQAAVREIKQRDVL